MQAPAVVEAAVARVSYLDPTGHIEVIQRENAKRLSSIKGTTAALLDNGNDTSGFFFQALADILKNDYGVEQVILKTKFASSKPADDGMIADMVRDADFMVAGVAL